MILFDPAGRVTACSEAARVVDSVFLIMNDNDIILEDGQGNVVVFRTQRQATRFRDEYVGSDPELWGIYEIYMKDLDVLLLNRPHICIGE